MKIKFIANLLLASLMLFSSAANSAWYEVTGRSAIVSTQEQARLKALEDAIYQAVNFSGADIGSISNLYPLLNANKNEFIFTNHEVRYVLVESRNIINDEMLVRAKIDIYPSAMGCHVEQYKKTFLVGNLNLESPQQAVMGQLYNIGDDFAEILHRQLKQEARSFISVGTTNYGINKESPERIKMIAEDKSVQYLLTGNITDMTATIAVDNAGNEIINRQFAFELRVFDGKTGNEIMARNYREVARWPFPKTSRIDTQSARFWASTYGEMLLNLSRQIMLDLESNLSCKITLPEIIVKRDGLVMMDLGRIHGVKEGDKLQLWHTGTFIDQRGIPRNKVTKSNITLTVGRVYEHEAELHVDQPNLASSIQIGDVMHKQL
ncbi:flagellar assembly protein FlgT [Vibrio sp. WJH972]